MTSRRIIREARTVTPLTVRPEEMALDGPLYLRSPQVRYCAAHGTNFVSDCPECNPEAFLDKGDGEEPPPIEDAAGFAMPFTSPVAPHANFHERPRGELMVEQPVPVSIPTPRSEPDPEPEPEPEADSTSRRSSR